MIGFNDSISFFLPAHDPTLLLLTGQWIVDAVNSYSQRFLPTLGMNGNFGGLAGSVGLPTGAVTSANQAAMVGQGMGGGSVAMQYFGASPSMALSSDDGSGNIFHSRFFQMFGLKGA